MKHEVNGWTNFGDVSPWHGQLWIKDAFPDSTQDYAECIEIIGPGYLGLADNQVMVISGSIYMPIDDKYKVKDACGVIGKTPSLASWVDLALAFHAYHGVESDYWNPQTVVQIGKIDKVFSNCEGLPADVILRGNAKLENYLIHHVLI